MEILHLLRKSLWLSKFLYESKYQVETPLENCKIIRTNSQSSCLQLVSLLG